MGIKFKKFKPSKGFIASILKRGGELNQGSKPMEFVLSKENGTVTDHTLDGKKEVKGKLVSDPKSSVKGYLRPVDPSKIKEMNQYGENLYSKLENGGLIFKKGGSVKDSMRCGETRKSTRPGKKIMQKVCKDGKEKLIHAGAKGYQNNIDSKRKAFKARHRCSEAKYGTPRWLACNKLW